MVKKRRIQLRFFHSHNLFIIDLRLQSELFEISDLWNGQFDVAVKIEGLFVYIWQPYLIGGNQVLLDVILEPAVIHHVNQFHFQCVERIMHWQVEPLLEV